MLRALRTSTAIATSLSLILSAVPVVAQDVPMICPDGVALPCAEGIEAIPLAKLDPAIAEALGMSEAVAAAAAAAAAAEPAAEAATTEEPAAEEAAPEEAPVAEEAVTEEPAAEEAAPEEAPVAEEAVTEEPAAEEAAPEEAPVAEEAVTEEPAAEEAAPEEASAGDADITEDDLAKALEADAAATAEDGAATTDTSAQPTGEAATATEEQPDATEATEMEAAAAEASQSSETLIGEVPPVPAALDEVSKELAADGVVPSTEVVPLLPEQPDPVTGEAPVADAAKLVAPVVEGSELAADAPVPEEEVSQVTEETISATTARSSSEDFANKVNELATSQSLASAAAPTVTKRKKGLSDFEKLALLGVGAMVVGAIISNNRKVEMNSGDRVIVSRDGQYSVIKDDDALLRQPGSKVLTETFRDGSTRTTVTRADGTRVVTIRDAEMRVLRRVHIDNTGRQTTLIDDLGTYEPVDVTVLPKPRYKSVASDSTEDDLRAALEDQSDFGRNYSLAQIRNIAEVRALVPVIDLDAITFETGSAAIRPDQAKALARLGKLIKAKVAANPREIFLIEGHTDAVGSAAYNLALSDRRAESVALALSEYFGVPTENMVVQGYGEEFLKVQSQGDERENRRASVRRITELLK